MLAAFCSLLHTFGPGTTNPFTVHLLTMGPRSFKLALTFGISTFFVALCELTTRGSAECAPVPVGPGRVHALAFTLVAALTLLAGEGAACLRPHPAVLAGAHLLLVQAEPVPGGTIFLTSGSLVLGAGRVVGFSPLTHAHTFLLT